MRKRGLILFLISIIFAVKGRAQNDELIVQGISPSLYLNHTVAAKENWYSIGRIYNISPKELAPFNQSSLEKPLAIGQLIRVPLVNTNFSQDNSKAAGEVFVPVYHQVQEKEWMYRISVNHNKVPVARLEKWNNIGKDQVKPGMRLIVGYLKVSATQSSLASKGSTSISGGSAPVTMQPEKKPDVAKIPNEPVSKTEPTKPVNAGNEPMTRQEPVKEPVHSQPEETHRASTVKQDLREGYFKTVYQPTGKSVTGNGNIFKSNSGWDDAKYYALVNNLAVGTIIKVINAGNSRFVYAKVLGSLPEMKESAGLIIRLSDAGAAQVGAPDGKFTAQLQY